MKEREREGEMDGGRRGTRGRMGGGNVQDQRGEEGSTEMMGG